MQLIRQTPMFSGLWAMLISAACRLTSCEQVHKTQMLQGSNTHPRPGPELGGFRIPVAVVQRYRAAAASPADLQLLPPKNSVLALIGTSQRFDQVNPPPGLQETAAGGNKTPFLGGLATAEAMCQLNPLLRLILLNS